jgi:glutamine synthetase
MLRLDDIVQDSYQKTWKSGIPVDFIFVEVANLQMELGYATFSHPEPVLHAVNRAWRGSRGTRMGFLLKS